MFQIIALLVTLASPISFFQRVERKVRGDMKQRLSEWASHSEDFPPYLQDASLQTDVWQTKRDGLSEDVWSAATRNSLQRSRNVRGKMRGLQSRRMYIIDKMDGRQSVSVPWDDYRRRRVCANATVAGPSLDKVLAALEGKPNELGERR